MLKILLNDKENQINKIFNEINEINENLEYDWFKKFWKIFRKAVLTVTSYNRNTIKKLLEYIVLTRKDKDENYILNQKKRVKEYEKIKEKGEKLLNAIMLSIRHGNKPDYKDNELDRKFMEFEEWLEEGIATIAGIKYNTMAYFKEILHMEESIANEENYKYWERSYPQPWKNNDITDMIIRKIVKEKGFTRENNIDNNNKEKAIGIAEKWVEKGHINVTIEDNDEITETEERLRRIKGLVKYLEIEVDEGELLMLIRMGYTDGDITNKDFIEKFQINKEKSSEEIKRILDEYLEISVNEDEEINEENELSIEEMIQKLLKERNEVLGIATEIEIRKLLEWGYNKNAILKNKIILQYKKLKIELDPFKEDDKEIREKLNEYILELEDKEKDEYDTDESEKIEEILSPGEYDEWNENIGNIREDEIENNINTEEFNLRVGQSVNEKIEELQRENVLARGILAPIFSGKSDEDVNEWIEEIETKFESTGRNAGNNNVNITTYAMEGLKKPALRWYRERKEVNVGNVVNWTNENNDNNLKEKIRQKFEGIE
ncbi:hypothetical protein C1646_754025, partial [Rhizophagus diaphanus]